MTPRFSKLLFVLASFLFFSPVWGQVDAAKEPSDCVLSIANEFAKIAPLKASGGDHGPLWHLKKGSAELYLYGTFHLGWENHQSIGPKTKQALDSSTVLVTEVEDMENIAVSEQLKLIGILQEARAKEGEFLLPLSQPLLKKLNAARDKLCIDASERLGADSVLPTLMSVMTLDLVVYKAVGLTPAFGSEKQLLQLAANKPQKYLETVQEQINALSLRKGDSAEELLQSYLDNIFKPESLVFRQSLLEAWQDGDSEKLNQKYLFGLNPISQTEKNIIHRLIDERNAVMAKRIVDLAIIDKERPFIAVGALHLFGTEGLISILKTQGFAATQISPS